ncbi:MAG: Rne/Rng family ribonuclease [Gemmatimonas sp.]
MIDEILVSVSPGETRIACLTGGRAVELHRFLHGRATTLGNVYLGRITRVVAGMGAAFVEIGASKAGFLPVPADPAARAALHEGARAIVQVTREPERGKGAQLSASVRLPGHFLVYMPTGDGIHVSRRIGEETDAGRIKAALEALSLPGEGWIARTNAPDGTPAQFAHEAGALRARWNDIGQRAAATTPPSLLYSEASPIAGILRDKASAAVRRIVVDDADAFAAAEAFLSSYRPELSSALSRHTGPIPLFEMEGIEVEFERVWDRRVPLPSGGSLVIERTEALWAIDVNTGRHIGGSSAEATIRATNLEAAVEAARQIRLRDLGGLIVVDFVHMDEDATGREQVLNAFRDALAEDPTPVRLTGFSDLGLIELSRRRGRPAVDQQFEVPCEVCDGTGFVQVPLLTALAAFREAARGTAAGGPIRIAVPPSVAAVMETPEAQAARRELVARSGRSVEIIVDSTVAADRFRLD